jgi:hypothetical protein
MVSGEERWYAITRKLEEEVIKEAEVILSNLINPVYYMLNIMLGPNVFGRHRTGGGGRRRG